MHTYKVGDEVKLTDATHEYMKSRGYRKVTGTGKVAYLDTDWKGVPSYSLDFGVGYEMESDRLMFYAEDVAPVTDDLIGKNVVLTLEAHKSFKEITGLSATYGRVRSKLNNFYGIDFEGLNAPRWFKAEEFYVLPIAEKVAEKTDPNVLSVGTRVALTLEAYKQNRAAGGRDSKILFGTVAGPDLPGRYAVRFDGLNYDLYFQRHHLRLSEDEGLKPVMGARVMLNAKGANVPVSKRLNWEAGMEGRIEAVGDEAAGRPFRLSIHGYDSASKRFALLEKPFYRDEFEVIGFDY